VFTIYEHNLFLFHEPLLEEIAMRSSLFMLFISLLLLGGCHTKQVRHLASDAALIKPGQTTVKDVQKYLGEPNSRREVSPGVSEFVYYEDRPGSSATCRCSARTGPSGYEMIVLTMKAISSPSSDFRNFNESDRKWVEDYTWDQEIK
jgi:hypothetical protein